MATEDERYRQSSQYRLWSYTPSTLLELRQKTNSLAKQQIAARLSQDASTPLPEFLTAEEEAQLTKLFMVQLIQAAIFCELPTEIRATAAIFLQRFYVTNSIMTYPPAELLKTSLFFACKSEGSMWQSGRLAEKFPNTTGEQVLAGEFLLCQGIRFAFDIRHPFRALDGAILELKKRLPAESERRIRKAHVDAREVLKYSSLVTDAYFHYTPSQIMMAALMIADSELVDMLFEGSSELVENAELTRKIRSTIQECKALLETEPPTRLAEYWGKPETLKMMKPLRRKLNKCRDPDRADLVALQNARRTMATKTAKSKESSLQDDAAVFGGDLKRRKVEDGKGGKAADMFGPTLGQD